MDRHYYQQHHLTVAKHPSETDERLMVRLLAFAMYADDALSFGKGLSTQDEPALWRKDLTGADELWIEVGQPDERTVRKSCGRANQVVVMLYGTNTDAWWKENRGTLIHKTNLTVIQLPPSATKAMAALVERTIQLTCNIEDGQIWLISEAGTVHIEPVCLTATPG